MGKIRVLLVEDNPANTKLCRKILEHRGHEVIEAGSVAEGRTRLSAALPEIVLLDIQIPGGGGEGLLREIRANPAWAHLPVLAVTALAMQGDEQRLRQAGFDGYIRKPIDTRGFGPLVESFAKKTGSAEDESPVEKILVLDDDPEFRQLVVPVLRAKGYRVLEARRGAEADEILRDHRLELAIVDVVLPDIAGPAWIEKIRAAGDQTKVLLVSAHWRTLGDLREMIAKLNITLVLHKPIIPAVFAELVESQLKPAAHSSTVKPGLEAELSAIRRQYASKLPERLHDLRQLIQRARQDPNDQGSFREVKTIVHNLLGTAGSHGFFDIGTILERVETMLRPAESVAALSDGDWALVDRSAIEAERTAGSSPTENLETGTIEPPDKVLVVDDKPETMEVLLSAASGRLGEMVCAKTFEEALEIARAHPPDAVVIDPSLGKDRTGFELAQALRALPGCEKLPLAFISDSPSLESRVEAAHAGAAIYLSRPVEVGVARSALEHLLSNRKGEQPQILLVDDDLEFCRFLGAMLARAGLAVTCLNESTRILELLGGQRPDLVLLDVGLPGVSGFDVCRILRTTPQWHDMPIMFLTIRTEIESRSAAFQAGADDYLVKPIVPEELLAKVQMALQRQRLLRERAERDPITGLLTRRAFLERLLPRMSEARRKSAPVSIGLLDLDHFKKINDTHGHNAGDRVLTAFGGLLGRRFRGYDLRGRWGGEEFVVAFPMEGLNLMELVLNRVLAEFCKMPFEDDRGASFYASFSAGVSSFPQDGASVEALISVADERLYAAKRAGRSRIVSSIG